MCFGRRGLGPVKVPELVPRRDIFGRQLRASPPGFAAIYEIGIPSGCGVSSEPLFGRLVVSSAKRDRWRVCVKKNYYFS